MGTPFPGSGYVTEKMYMLLQLYLQNKGWNNPMEWLQCFTDLKDPSLVPSASYFQMMASRITLDSQGRLVLRENGKIILPFEHFANAVMLKHMNGPHGMHLGLEATVRSVVESYTIGRDNFGMDKDFILEVVNSCPNPACRYYKTQLDITHPKPTYIPEPPEFSQFSTSPLIQITNGGKKMSKEKRKECTSRLSGAPSPASSASKEVEKQQQVLLQQQQQQQQQLQQQVVPPPVVAQPPQQPPPPPPPVQTQSQQQTQTTMARHQATPPATHQPTTSPADITETLESLTNANKDLLALHNGTWMQQESDVKRTANYPLSSTDVSQEKIVRAFAEIMKNMHRMKTCVRPAMCKPYGKQSESLQKTLMDTIQLVQSLRSFLPPPHIQVSSWKNEDKHRKGMTLEDLCDRKLD